MAGYLLCVLIDVLQCIETCQDESIYRWMGVLAHLLGCIDKRKEVFKDGWVDVLDVLRCARMYW
jgi:hypothetical protein